MASDSSFDIASKVDEQEIVNAIDQAMREITNRYDFRDCPTTIELNKEEKTITITTTDDYKVRASNEILRNKLVKRGAPLKAFTDEPAVLQGMNKMVQKIKIQDGIPQEKAKEIVRYIKEQNLKKIQATIQKDVVRVSGPKKDDLQQVMAVLKAHDFGIDMQFTNYR
ncbi:MAG: YajQ family cyclic di-GMP-binding protein [Spirochaetia bacterium]|nr:YajQ family cyclic di-GMP-binding protein [Spirochaetia bacterium]